MNMKIYGFGSFFNGSEIFGDIDLLIIHSSNSYESCLDAIALKQEIVAHIDNADVTMLSKSEEFQFKFIEKTHAIPLCSCRKRDRREVVRDLKLSFSL